MIKFIIISILCILLMGCTKYAIVTKQGVIAGHIKSREDCEAIIQKFKIDGICVVE